MEHGKAEIDGDSIRLVSGVQGHSGDASVHLDRWTAFKIELASPLDFGALIGTRVRPLHDLLAIAIGRSIRLTSLLLLPTGGDPRNGLGEASYAAIQPSQGETASLAALLNYTAPTILTRPDSPIPMDDLLRRWFREWPNLREAIALLLAPTRVDFMYSQHRFACTFQSAEALHKVRFQQRELPTKEHHQRVDAIVQAATAAGVDINTIDWAKRVLQSKNDKPLWRRIEELLQAVPAAGTAILSAAPDYCRAVAGDRARVSHPVDGRYDSAKRYWQGEVLRWIVRGILLTSTGISEDEVSRRIAGRHPFQHALLQVSG